MATKRHSTTDIPTDGKCIRTMPPFALDKRALALWLAVQAATRNDDAPPMCHRHRNRPALVWLDGAALCGDCAVKKLRCDTEKGGDAA